MMVHGLRHSLRAGLAACALLAAGACAAPESAAPTQPMHHPTIVSLNPCSDAILAEVTEPGQILAISHYSKDPRSSSMDPAMARALPATRGTVEEVLALAPDIVVASSFIDPATRAAYDRAGLQVETLGIAATVEQSMAQIRQLAAIAGHPQRGEALVGRIERALAAAAPAPGSPIVDAALWQAGGMVPGEGTLITDLLGRTGFSSATLARGLGQADTMSLEAMLADPPRVIITVTTADATGNDARALSHPVLGHLAATRRETLDPGLLYCGGPTIIAAAGRLAAIRQAVSLGG